MAIKTYYVDPNRTLRHDGKDTQGGEPIKLDEAVAAPLLELGILLKDKPEAAVKKELAEVEAELAEANTKIETLSKENGKLKTDLEAVQKELTALKTPKT